MSDFIELPMDIEDVSDPAAGPEGTYGLVIRDVKTKDNGNKLVIIDVVTAPPGVDPDDIASVLHNVAIPNATDDADKVKNKMRFIKRFLYLFNIPFTGAKLDTASWIGKQATAHLTQEEYEGNISNKIKLPNVK